MTAEAFEQRVLSLWMTTRIPLTRPTLCFLTGASRKKVEAWLKQLVVDGVLDADVDDSGEIVYAVRGAERPAGGATTVAELEKKGALEREVRGVAGKAAQAAGAMVLAREAGRDASSRGVPVPAGKRKSVIASGALSFFFGPAGWLYAGPWQTAVPAAVLYVVMWSILPGFLAAPLLGIVNPVSAAVGAAYAWKYNQKGKRVPLLPPEGGTTK